MENIRKSFLLIGVIDFLVLNDKVCPVLAAENAIKGGVTAIIIKENHCDKKKCIETAEKIRDVCHEYDVLMIAQGSVNFAYNCKADGILLDLEHGDLIYARRVMGKKALIGAVVHDICDALTAWAAGSDYIYFEETFVDEINVNENLGEICHKIKIPIVAAGGINHENIVKLRDYDISGVSLSRTLFSWDNPYGMALFIKDILKI